MFTFISVLLFAQTPHGEPADLDGFVATADAVAVAEFRGDEGHFATEIVHHDNGNIIRSGEYGDVVRRKFVVHLTMKGSSLPTSTTCLDFVGTVKMGYATATTGTYYLIPLRQPVAPNRLLVARKPDDYYQSESRDQWGMPPLQSLHQLPAGEYTNLGSTPFERVGGVLAQAYERSLNAAHLRLLEDIVPRHPALLTILPEYAEFYSSSLEPRLLVAAGENPEQKSHVLRTAAIITGEQGYQRFWTFISDFDATADPAVVVWIEMGVFKPDDVQRLMNLARIARTAAVRAAAIRALIHRASEEQRDIFISLLNDSNQQVRVAALLWLDQIQTDPRYKVKRVNRDTIANEEELIRYWQGR